MEIKKIVLLSGVLSIILFLTLLIVSDMSLEASIFRMSSIITGVSLFWFYLDRYGWRQKAFRIGGWLCNVPDLRGRWEGTLKRDVDPNHYEFVIEIHQTLTNLKCYTYAEDGNSNSFCTNIISGEEKSTFSLIYSWIGQSERQVGEHYSGMFYGTTKLNYIDSVPAKLTGEYFTNRIPTQTKGRLNLQRVSYETKGEFKSIRNGS